MRCRAAGAAGDVVESVATDNPDAAVDQHPPVFRRERSADCRGIEPRRFRSRPRQQLSQFLTRLVRRNLQSDCLRRGFRAATPGDKLQAVERGDPGHRQRGPTCKFKACLRRRLRHARGERTADDQRGRQTRSAHDESPRLAHVGHGPCHCPLPSTDSVYRRRFPSFWNFILADRPSGHADRGAWAISQSAMAATRLSATAAVASTVGSTPCWRRVADVIGLRLATRHCWIR